MQSTGIVRKIDSLGRIVIPKETRDVNGWEEGTPMEILSNNGQVVLRELTVSCCICSEKEELVEFYRKKICKKCLAKLKTI